MKYPRDPNRAPRQKSAEEWYIVNQREDLDENDCLEFLEWLERDARNMDAYAEVEKTSGLMKQAAQEADKTAYQPRAIGPVFRSTAWTFALAASFAFTIIVAGIFLYATNRAETYRTAIGEQRTVILEDGSLVRLNTSTSISVDFDNRLRRIALENGEAYFDVQKDARPFIVEFEDGYAQAVGTGFNVRREQGVTVVNVLEGVVEITTVASSPSTPTSSSEISEGFQITINSKGALGEPEASDANRINAWVAGRLEFSAEPLVDVVSEFNRYSRQELVIADERLGDILISGSFTIGRSEEFALGLEEAFPIVLVKGRNRLLLHAKIDKAAAAD